MTIQRVYYPHGGKHYLLRWWTHNDQQHIVLASLKESVESIAKSVFRKHSDAQIRDYLLIEIVAPSLRLQALSKAHRRKDEIANFKREIHSNLREVLNTRRQLPIPFTACSSYEPEEDVKREKWAKESHYSCRNCFEWIIFHMPDEELFTKYSEAWFIKFPKKPYVPRGLVDSRAIIAEDDEPLWYAQADFGHHSKGIVLDKIDLSAAEEYRPGYLTDNVLFYYRLLDAVDMTLVQKFLTDITSKEENTRVGREKARSLRFKQEKKERIDQVIAFFQSTE